MRKLLTLLFVICMSLFLGYEFGYGFCAFEIQETCEADSGATVINGTPYICLSRRQLELLRRQAQEQGA